MFESISKLRNPMKIETYEENVKSKLWSNVTSKHHVCLNVESTLYTCIYMHEIVLGMHTSIYNCVLYGFVS